MSVLICMHVYWYIFTYNYVYQYKKAFFPSFFFVIILLSEIETNFILAKLIIISSLSIPGTT